MDLVVAPTRSGLLVPGQGEGSRSVGFGGDGRLGDAQLVDWSVAADWVREREATTAGFRWVWPDTAAIYPRLLAAGVRVRRCHDLRLGHAILRWAAPEPWEAPHWLTSHAGAPDVEAAAPTLLDGMTSEPGPSLAEVVAEHERQHGAVTGPTTRGLPLLLAAESAGALIAGEMHADGLPWDRDRHDAILSAELGPRPPRGMRPERLEQLARQIRELLHAPTLNPDSQATLLTALRHAGLDVRSTAKWELAGVAHPVVTPLLEYKRLARLLAANGWGWLDTWVTPGVEGRRGRFRTDYVPGGVVTGRWATSGGGALQIPRAVRAAVVADPGWVLVVADAAQVEPRALAGMAGDEALAAAGRGGDLYAGLVTAGVVETREAAKVGMLSALYGGTSGEAGVLLPRLRRAYPRATSLVDRAAEVGAGGGTVRTWLGRTSPPPGPTWQQVQGAAGQIDAQGADERRARGQARERGRFTRNFVVQGTAAEWALCWMAETRRRLRELAPADLPTTPPARHPGSEQPESPQPGAGPPESPQPGAGPPESAQPGAGPPESAQPGTGQPHLVFFLHDEIVVHTPEPLAGAVEEVVVAAAQTAGRLLFGDFPITFPLHVATVDSYADADK